MADADIDFGGGYDHRITGAISGLAGTLQRGFSLVGALTSLGLVVAAVFWAYNLAIRDVQGVPVIQALEGPMRVAPLDPEGEIIDYQGLAVNDVAAAGVATPLPDRLILAPRPLDLDAEDQAGLAGQETGDDYQAQPAAAAIAGSGPVLAAEPPSESANPTAVAIDAALAEALGDNPADLAEDESLALPEVDLAAAPLPDGAMPSSVRPRARPLTLATAPVETPVPASIDGGAAPVAPEIDPATIPLGTRLVQFGAFDTEEEARAAWVQLEVEFGEIMAGKSLVLQPAESGGHTFLRLRAHGFEDEDDARRFCTAFVAKTKICIPVPQR